MHDHVAPEAVQPPLWLSLGLRPFFFLGALAMAGSVLIWIPVLLGGVNLPTFFSPRDWHIHTLLFGGVPAIVAGFALTAVSNWTGRPPVSGTPLLLLILAWCIGRVAVSTSALIGPVLAVPLDLLFPLSLSLVFGREVVKSGNLRNLRIVALVALLGACNLAFHLESLLTGSADHATRAGVSIVLVMIMVIGGRIIPAFTRNWLKREGHLHLPPDFGKGDAASLVVSLAALVLWSAVAGSPEVPLVLALAGGLNIWRLSRWCGLHTTREPLLLILHLAFATIPFGFLALAVSTMTDAIPAASALHIWTAGTIGLMTLAVMTRASRGHSGQPLTAGRLDIAIFCCIVLGTIARVFAPLADTGMMHALQAAAGLWAGGYLLFAIGYFPVLFRTR
ncbi:NnrS family protein [Roseibium aestuarii]|uniref:NnrS family protein n=1 Tax=Roseibium aestuarii TaxID=2600299 RepID=A0ABW4JYT4_9HYPH|nr:NnrS family protein [Roseibium aestuarii]